MWSCQSNSLPIRGSYCSVNNVPFSARSSEKKWTATLRRSWLLTITKEPWSPGGLNKCGFLAQNNDGILPTETQYTCWDSECWKFWARYDIAFAIGSLMFTDTRNRSRATVSRQPQKTRSRHAPGKPFYRTVRRDDHLLDRIHGVTRKIRLGISAEWGQNC